MSNLFQFNGDNWEEIGKDGSPDTPEQVRDKLELLKDDDRLDVSAVKGAVSSNELRIISDNLRLSIPKAGGGSGGIEVFSSTGKVGSGSALKFTGSGVASVASDGHTTTIDISGGGGAGTPGGSDTQLQYNNAGAFGGIAGATTNGTSTTFTTGNLIAHDVKASQSAGIDILSSSGTVTALFGAGGGANSTFYGGSKFDYSTATTVPYFDASKNLISSAVTPTELGYLSGVTSAIQTQLSGKWSLTGNAGTTAGTNFIGTTDAIDVVFKRDSVEQFRLTGSTFNFPTAGWFEFSDNTGDVFWGHNGTSKGTFLAGASNASYIQLDSNGVSIENGSLPFSLKNQIDLRFYEGVNYVGFKAPALSGNVIWTLPTTDSTGTQALVSDGAGTLSWSSIGGGSGITIGTTTITSGTTTKVLYDNAGVVGEYTISGSGDVAMTNSPVFITPALGTPASGVVTNLTGTASININGTVGATTPTTGVFTTATINTGLVPDVDDGAYLGQSGTAFSDLFLASGGVINWNAGDVTATHSANGLAFAGASNGYTFDARVSASRSGGQVGLFTRTDDSSSVSLITFAGDRATPTNGDNGYFSYELSDSAGSQVEVARTYWSASDVTAGAVTSDLYWSVRIAGSLTRKLRLNPYDLSPFEDDILALGNTSQMWSDLFLASGSVVNFNNGDVTLTHSTGAITLDGGNLNLGENTSVVLDPALSADGKWTGITRAGTAGATLAFGDLCYLAAADSRWELADADAAATSGDVILGMCVLAAAADGDPTVMLLIGNIRADTAFPALTIGAPAYVGTTAGDIQTAQPSGTDDVIRRVGFALTADELYFNPSNDYITHT